MVSAGYTKNRIERGTYRLFVAELLLWIAFLLGTFTYYAYQAFFVSGSIAHRVIGVGGLYFFVLLPVFAIYHRVVGWTLFGAQIVTPVAQGLLVAAGPVWLLARPVISVPSFAVAVGYLPVFLAVILMKRAAEETSPQTAKEAVRNL